MRVALIKPSPVETYSELQAALLRAELEVFDFSWDNKLEALQEAKGYVLVSNPGAASVQASKTEAAKGKPGEGAALEAIIQALKIETAKGKPLLGLGEGAAFLIESGLIPGLYKNWVVNPPLLHAARGGEGRGEEAALPQPTLIRLSQDYQYNAFTRYLTPQHLLPVRRSPTSPVFHVPGGLLRELESQGLNVFLYCNNKGQPHPDDTHPGANIAALSNKAGNLMALIPHPEGPEGDSLFHSMRDHIASGYVAEVTPLDYWPRR